MRTFLFILLIIFLFSIEVGLKKEINKFNYQIQQLVNLENAIMFECHEAYAFGNSDIKEAVVRIMRGCADYVDKDDIENPALVIFLDKILKDPIDDSSPKHKFQR